MAVWVVAASLGLLPGDVEDEPRFWATQAHPTEICLPVTEFIVPKQKRRHGSKHRPGLSHTTLINTVTMQWR